MTFEKKCYVRPEDIVAVRIRCANCKASTSIPIASLPNSNLQGVLTRECPYCQKASGIGFGTTEMEQLIRFNNLLARLADSLKGRNIEYGFEVECESPKEVGD
jgi:hypothetical protein